MNIKLKPYECILCKSSSQAEIVLGIFHEKNILDEVTASKILADFKQNTCFAFFDNVVIELTKEQAEKRSFKIISYVLYRKREGYQNKITLLKTGRKKIDEEKKKKSRSVCLNNDQYKALKDIAIKEKLSISDLIIKKIIENE